MCKKRCPCAKITDDSSYSKEARAVFAKDAATYAKLSARQKEDFTGYRFDGKIKNYMECETLSFQGYEGLVEKTTESCIAEARKNNSGKSAKERAARESKAALCKTDKAGFEAFRVLVKALETNLDCQGMCTPSTWWWNKDITTGSPQVGCMLGIKRNFNETSGAAAVVMVIAVIVSLTLFCCSCGAICNTKED